MAKQSAALFSVTSRNKSLVVAFIVLLCIPFILVAYTGGVADLQPIEIARVDGERVFVEELNFELRNLLAQNRIDSELTPALQDLLTRQALDSLTTRRAVASFARDEYKIKPPLSAVASRVALNAPTLAQDGSLTNQEIDTIAGQFNLRRAELLAYFETAIAQQLFLGRLANSDYVSFAEALQYEQLSQYRRNFNIVELNTETFYSAIDATEEQLQQYYNTHEDQYQAAEVVRLSYIEWQKEQAESQVQITDQEIDALLPELIEAAEQDAEWHLAHIEWRTDDADEDDVLEQAQQVYAQLQSGALTFEAAVAAYSQDIASAEEGGDLGLFILDNSLPESFVEAVKSKTSGEITEPFIAETSVHIVKVLEQGAAEINLDALRTQARNRLENTKATEIFNDKLTAISEQAYEVEDLTALGIATALNVGNTADVALTGDTNLLPAPLNHAEVLATVRDIIDSNDLGLMSDPVRTSDGIFVVKVDSYTPAHTLDYSNVADRVVDDFRASEAAERINSARADLTQQLNSGKTLEQAVATVGASDPVLAESLIAKPYYDLSLTTSLLPRGLLDRIFVELNMWNPEEKWLEHTEENTTYLTELSGVTPVELDEHVISSNENFRSILTTVKQARLYGLVNSVINEVKSSVDIDENLDILEREAEADNSFNSPFDS